ncbi:MAG: DMT family transporter, partial [Alphaproteobacteria bacterium]
MTTGNAPAASAPLSASAKGILCMILGVFVLTTQDAITKWMTDGYHPGEITFYRGLFSFLPILLFATRDGGWTAFRARRLGPNILRAFFALATSVLIVWSFSVLPLAEALAIVFASPLILAALSGPLLGERVGWRRWTCVGVGFIGVLLLTRPGPAGIALVVLIPLAAAVCSALRDIVTRRLGGHDSSTTILFYTQLVAVIATGPSLLIAFSGWPSLGDWLLFAIGGILVGIAHYFIIQAFLLAEAATVAPLRYLALVYAAAIGALVWGDLPDAWA